MMKLNNLSLAVLVSLGVAACGGSDDNNSNKPADNGNKNQSQNQHQNQNNNQNNQAADQNIVDPTGTKVVDNKDLSKEQTVGTLQYVRRDGSRYDREVNPSKPASASPLLGVDLGQQNPSLTNIVLARQQVTRPDGVPVRAQFAGMDNPVPLKNDGTANHDSKTEGNGLQEENFRNVDLFAGMYAQKAGDAKDAHANTNNTDDKGKFNRTPSTTTPQVASIVRGNAEGANGVPLRQALANAPKGKSGEAVYADAVVATGSTEVPASKSANVPVNEATYSNGASSSATLSAIIDRTHYRVSDGDAGSNPVNLANAKLTGDKQFKDINGQDLYYYRGVTAPAAGAVGKTTTTLAYAQTAGTRYGKDLVWWSAPETAFENEFTRTGKDTLDADKVTNKLIPNTFGSGATSKTAYENGAAATNGLVRIGNGMNTLGQELNYNKETGKWEDHHNTTTRIFGRYHLAYANTDKRTVNPVALNSYSGAKSFIAEYETNNASKATQYSIGAAPMTLNYVQYGRVSTNLDLDAGEGGYSDHFMRNPYLHKNDEQGVDNYFYRGTNATTIAQMEALPSNQTAVYNGHALMYGIDNDFHGGANRNLPNAFAGGSNGLGLGNFVQANVNFGQKRVTGNVYNEWLTDPAKNVTVKDNLVQFQGKIEGNTVVGTADRTYIGGDDNATFKASFFGEKAEEMGGSFNSVTDTDKYGPAYGTNDWGGVFGATKGGSGNTFQGDDSANKYGGL